MKHLIISPHTDDAIFSLGSFILCSGHDITILSPFAGIPEDAAGRKKHTTLRAEHKRACEIIGVKYINGDFLDDVYAPTNKYTLMKWFMKMIKGYDRIYVPLGIHHPDHQTVRNLFVSNFTFHYVYEELPYRVLYPELYESLKSEYIKPGGRGTVYPHNPLKELAVEAYKSQIADHLFPQLYVEERIWKV